MGVFEKIAKFVGSPTALRNEVGDALQQSYTASALTQARFQRLAQMAPQEASAAALKALAMSEGAHCQKLLDAIAAAGGLPPLVPAIEDISTNHWGRLVAALENNRQLVQALRERTMEFAETFPVTAQLLAELRDNEAMHCERLRDLIARADPQAMD